MFFCVGNMIQKSFTEVHQVLLSSIDNMHVDNLGLQRESGFNVMEVLVRDMDQVVSRFEVVRKGLSNFKLRSQIRREETIVRPMSGSGYGSVDEVHIKGDRGNSCSVI